MASDSQFPIHISDAFVTDILAPYRADARYLKSASITHISDTSSGSDTRQSALMRGIGRFAIADSCYLDGAAYFNAVEFNICYNQLAYVLFGKCIESGILQKLSFLTFADYKAHQLPSWLIASIESRYLKRLETRDFHGYLSLDRAAPVGGAWFFFTTMTFSDAEGIKAKGSVVLAFSPH
jgi:hypothetical protein